MSESLFPTFRKISQTPLRDIVRFRLTSRLDWKSQLAATELPSPAKELIARVVMRTRLFRLEKASVASELSAHFLDGLKAGNSATELVELFGDERVAAKLIRRAKHRARPLPWHILKWTVRATGMIVGIYALCLIRFCAGHPTLKVDYIAKMNESISYVPDSQRAWPLWRQAILSCSEPGNGEPRTFAAASQPGQIDNPIAWSDRVDWLKKHQAGIEMARQAASRPVFGFVIGPAGSINDSALFNLGQKNRKMHPAAIGYFIRRLRRTINSLLIKPAMLSPALS